MLWVAIQCNKTWITHTWILCCIAIPTKHMKQSYEPPSSSWLLLLRCNIAILQYFVFTHIWTSYTLNLQQYRFITYIPPLYKECIFLFMPKYSQHGPISSKKILCSHLYAFEFRFWTWKVTKTVKYPKYITTAAMHFTGWLHSKAHSI